MLELDKIYNMDCIDGMKQLDDNSIDLVLTDPPFGIKHDNVDWDNPFDFKELMKKLDLEFMRILKEGGYYFIWIPKKELTKIGTYLDNIQYFFEIHPFARYKVDMRWINCLSPLIVKIKGKPNKNIEGGKNYFLTNSANTSNKNNPRKINHPSSKGLDICNYIIKHYTTKNSIVLDCFVGSGSILLSCKKFNRNFIGFEINKDYYNYSLKRLLTVPERLDNWIDS